MGRWALAVAAVLPLVAIGCGGERQDANEPSGTYKVSIVRQTFPSKQTLARRELMTIAVRNEDTRALPNVAVTVNSFTRPSDQPGLADPNRPVWIVDGPPRGTQVAYTNTWALDRTLAPGQSATFTWRVMPVVPGTHAVKFRVAAGLDGKAKAQLASGGIPQGTFTVNISGKPAQSRVDPDTGKVIREP
jgi:hypothetical protein